MNESTFFDTHEFVKGAIDAGIAPPAAEYLADKAAQALKSNLATKIDLQALEARLQAEIIAAKFDLLKWIVMALIAQGGLIVALVKFL